MTFSFQHLTLWFGNRRHKKVSDPGIIQLGGIKYMIHRTQKGGWTPLLESQEASSAGWPCFEGQL